MNFYITPQKKKRISERYASGSKGIKMYRFSDFENDSYLLKAHVGRRAVVKSLGVVREDDLENNFARHEHLIVHAHKRESSRDVKGESRWSSFGSG